MTNDYWNGTRFGLYVPQLRTDAATMISAGRAAEDAGFGSFWLMDHLLAPGAPPSDVLESWTLLSALAMSTSSIRLGHLVGSNPFRHPSLLAKMAVTVDHLSDGRLDLGLGWGSVDAELEAFGFGGQTRAGRAEALGETLEILALMFSGTVFDFQGKHFQLRGAYGMPVPVQGHIPIHIGGAGRTLTMPLVARHADWWNCVGSARAQLERIAPLRGRARISAQYAVGLLRTESERAEVTAKLARRMPEPAWGAALVGTASELVDLFAAERSRGVELFVVRLHDLTDASTIRLFGEGVISMIG